MSNSEQIYTNRLIKEKSPYLLQHAHNPVDWYPWSNEAFEKAKKEDKPIFLSIGYSTCHWCHVMEEESFTNAEIAQFLNENFISIKVDREERPDIDNIYMKAVIALTGSGGWPLTVFITPDKKPFYGGTYFPPYDKLGRTGLMTILKVIKDAWKNNREKLLQSSNALKQILENQAKLNKSTSPLNEEILKKAYQQFLSNFDALYGGFGTAPKFPSGHSLSFLLRYWKRTNEIKALQMVEKTLSEMAKGGIYDHIGGGFHRYSTDAQWKLPHFEKMLYDQAILSKIYLEAYQATSKNKYAQIANEILTYVLRDMTSPEGGFYCAEDADSPSPENINEKKEGAFYLWNYEEISSLLNKNEAELFAYIFNIKPKGNISSLFQEEFNNKNILYIAHTADEAAKFFNKPIKEIEQSINISKKKLLKKRLERIRPHLDDKILVNWNGLMISSFALASRILKNPNYLNAAEKAAKFILNKLLKKDGTLYHRYRDGESAITGNIEDYAFFIQSLLDLYEATFNPMYLKEAKNLTNKMIDLFWDSKEGGFFFTSYDSEKLIASQKEFYDGALPSGNSIAALNIVRLSRFTMDKELIKKAELLFDNLSSQINEYPIEYSQLLIAFDFLLGPSKEIIISGNINSKETTKIIDLIFSKFIPNKIVAFRPNTKDAKEIISIIPYIENQVPLEGKTTVYICKNYSCKFPITDIKKLTNLLESN